MLSVFEQQHVLGLFSSMAQSAQRGPVYNVSIALGGKLVPSLAAPMPDTLSRIPGFKMTPVTTVEALRVDVEAFFVHLQSRCPFFFDGSPEAAQSLMQIFNCLQGICQGEQQVTDPEHMDYLSKALRYLQHSSCSNALVGFGIKGNNQHALTGEYARFFQAGETHATRAAAVIDHLVRQSRYFYQVLARTDYAQLVHALAHYACDSGPINAALLGLPNACPQAQHHAKVLVMVLQDPRMPGIKGPFTLYRGIGSRFWAEGGPRSVQTPFLHSTTTDVDTMRRFATKGQWMIQIRAGDEAKVLHMGQLMARQENEFILGPCFLEQVQQLSVGQGLEAPAFVYAYNGGVPCAA